MLDSKDWSFSPLIASYCDLLVADLTFYHVYILLILLILVRNGQWTIRVSYIAKVAILGMAIRENSCGLIY